MIVQAGSTNVTTYFVLRTAADGTATTGATITDIDLQYCRSGAAPSAKADATALAATNSAHADNKAFEIDGTDAPGLYRVDWPDAAFAAGVREVILTVKLASSFIEHLRVELSPAVDVQALDGDETAADNLKLQYDTTGLIGGTFPASQAQVGSSVIEYPDAGRMMAGASEAGDYTKLAVNDDDYWECTDPDNSNPLEMCVYVNGASGTFPDAVVIEARYNAQNNRRVHVFAANVDDVVAVSDTTATATDASPSVLTHSAAGSFAGLSLTGYDIYITSGTNATLGFYTIASHTDDAITLDRNCSSGGAVSVIDFIVMVWDQISNDTNAILHKTGEDGEYEYPLGVSYMTTDNNEVFLRFSDEGQGSFKTTYDLRLDQVGVITKSLAGGSVSAETYAAAVHTELDDHFRHIPSFTGEVSYVSPAGSDGNSGHDPASPLLTIGAAITLATAGDYIKVFAASFTEAVVLNKDGLELHGEIGARITGNGGVPLTISADYCRVDELILTPAAGQVALVVSGDYNKIQVMRTIGGTIAVQDTGTGNEITLVAATEYTTTGFDLQGPGAYVCDCLAVSSQASTRGYYLSNTAADRTTVNRSTSVNNDTAGFEVISGVTNAAFTNCIESPTCGTRVDAGTNTAWRNHSRTDHQTNITEILVDTATTLPATLAIIGTDTARLTAARAAVLTDWINGGRLDSLLDAIPTTTMRGTDGALTTKTGFKLASDGLDAVATTEPAGVASNFREMIVATWRRFFKKHTLTATELKTYKDDASIATTQDASDDDTTQTLGNAT